MKKIILVIMMITILQTMSAGTLKVYPSEDAFTSSWKPSWAHGSIFISDLGVGYSPSKKIERSYLKFDLTGIENIESAELNLRKGDSLRNPVIQVYKSNTNSWQEETITWNNQPNIQQAEFIGEKTFSQEDWFEFDIDGNYLEENVVSFILKGKVESGSSKYAYFDSVNYTTGNDEDYTRHPYLEITYGDGNECNTEADADCNGCVSLLEMVSLMSKYKKGQTELSLLEMVNIMARYKGGEITC